MCEKYSTESVSLRRQQDAKQTSKSGGKMESVVSSNQNMRTLIHPLQFKKNEASTLSHKKPEGKIVQMRGDKEGHLETFKAMESASVINQVQNDNMQTDAEGKMQFQNKPLIVFETFGGDSVQLQSIYEQTLSYDGNTICILGINEQDTKGDENAVMAKARTLQTSLVAAERGYQAFAARNHLDWVHKWYISPFLWTKPRDVRSSYEVPYFEVRKKLMVIASSLTRDVDNVVYRWIDRDVTGDTSVIPQNQAGSEQLRKLAGQGEDPALVTGVYSWVYSPERLRGLGAQKDIISDMAVYLNEAESELRAYFFSLCDKYNIQPERCYLPEPVLFYNKAAHEAAIGKLSTAIQTIAEYGQDGESKAAVFGTGKEPIGRVIFSNDLTVEKPVKLDHGISYLHYMEEAAVNYQKAHDDYYRELSTGQSFFTLKSSQLFFTALNKTRQSAFNNSFWCFKYGAVFDKWHSDIAGMIRELPANRGYNLRTFAWAMDPKNPRPDVLQLLAQIDFCYKRREVAENLHKVLIRNIFPSQSRFESSVEL